MTARRARRPARRPATRRGRAPQRRTPALLWMAAVVVAGGVALAFLLSDGSGSPAAGAFVGGDLHSLVVDPTDPARLFVGGHQAVAVSSDGGATWSQIPSLRDADAMGWAFTDDAVWVSGHPGLSHSTDGGRTFERANEGLPHTDVHALGAGGGVLYGASPAVGVFASTDGGDSWELRAGEVGQSFFGRILVDPDDPDRLVAADARNGPVASSDGGRTWASLGGLPMAVWVSGDDDELVASGPAGAARTTDGGRTWEPLELPDDAVLVEAMDQPGLLYAAGLADETAKVWVSRDAGDAWSVPSPAEASPGARDGDAAPVYQAMHGGLCAAADAARAGDIGAARTAFLDRSHQAVHELSAAAGDADRAVAARLHEAKQAAEEGLDGRSHELTAEVVAARLGRLAAAARAAMVAIGFDPAPAC